MRRAASRSDPCSQGERAMKDFLFYPRDMLVRAMHAAVDVYCALSPVQRGKIRLRCWAARAGVSLGPVLPRLIVVKAGGCALPMWVCPTSSVGAGVWAIGRFDAEGVEACVAALRGRPGAVFLDIGAHCGLFGVFAAATCPRLRVIAVEPSPSVRELLRRNIAGLDAAIRGQGSSVEVVAAALGDDGGAARFHRLNDDGFSSLYEVPHGGGETITVPMRRGDEVLAALGVGKVDVCKLDVEGAELRVLRGLERTLGRHGIRWLRMEINRERCAAAGHRPADLVGLLAGHGYRMTAASAARYATVNWEIADFEFLAPDAG